MPLSLKYRSFYKLKASLFVIAIILIGGLLYYSQHITNKLRQESRETVTFYAEVYAKFASQYEVEDFSFFFEEFIGRITFPVIISSVDGTPSAWKNLNFDSQNKNNQTISEVKKLMEEMDSLNEPISLSYREPGSGSEIVIAVLHYGDSKLITQLKWLPFIEIAVATLFILLGFAGFQFIRRSERQLIWVGMAKETAHQLGTPLSSLLGWLELLEDADKDKTLKLLSEMKADVKRLNRIANRFSQIGTGGGLKQSNLNEVIERVVAYLKKRLPQKGKTIELTANLENIPEIPLNVDLFEWALENIIKNSADAISRDNGKIEIFSSFNDKTGKVEITVKDNGVGIQGRFRKEIFKPGYSTKSKGWGLGLSLAKRIIEEYHGGELSLKESKQDEGTTMQIILSSK